jgi:putative peptidoglycan lipid II flippase
VALGQSLASIAQVIVATWLLNRRLGGIGVGSWMSSIARFALAAVPAAAAGWGVFLLTGGNEGWTTTDKIFGALGAALIGTVTLAVYGAVLAIFRAPELRPAVAIVQRFLPRR